MLRLTVSVLVLLLGAGLSRAQSLADVAAREKEKRSRRPPGAKAYTDADLKPHSSASGPPAPNKTSPPGEDVEAVQMALWRGRVSQLRDSVQRSEKRVAQIQAQLEALRSPLGPLPASELLEPPHQQDRLDKILKAQGDLENAKVTLARDQKAWADFEEEARRSRIPPGWLREP